MRKVDLELDHAALLYEIPHASDLSLPPTAVSLALPDYRDRKQS